MKTLELTKRARILKEYESNQATIRQAVGLTDIEYKEKIYLTGLEFLESIYPSSENIYEDIKGTIERDKFFWLWWMAEFSDWEQDLIDFCRNHDTDLKYWYFEGVDQMMGLPEIEASYQALYLKRAKNIRIK